AGERLGEDIDPAATVSGGHLAEASVHDEQIAEHHARIVCMDVDALAHGVVDPVWDGAGDVGHDRLGRDGELWAASIEKGQVPVLGSVLTLDYLLQPDLSERAEWCEASLQFGLDNVLDRPHAIRGPGLTLLEV